MLQPWAGNEGGGVPWAEAWREQGWQGCWAKGLTVVEGLYSQDPSQL